MKKQSVKYLISQLSDSRRVVVNGILNKFNNQLEKIPGSISKHQVWEGGLSDHIAEVANIASILYPVLSELRPLPFTLEDALFVLFLHDYDKLERYDVINGEFIRKTEYKNLADHLRRILKDDYGYELSELEYNAIKYIHGEGEDYSKDERVMNPLAAFVHCRDIISARIWYDFGKDRENW